MFNKIYTPIRALSLGSALGDLRDDWEVLTKIERRVLDTIPWIIVIFALGLLVCTFFLGGSTVHVSARTEHVIYTPLYSDPPVWFLKNAVFLSTRFADADLFLDDSESSSVTPLMATVGDQKTALVNGFLQLSCGDQVTISRVGTGLVSVDVRAVRDVVVTDEVGDVVVFDEPLGDSFVFQPHSEDPNNPLDGDIIYKARALMQRMSGSSYVWPMEGQIVPSRPVGVDTVDTQGLMLSGRAELLNRRFISGSNYLVDEHSIELGDHLVLDTTRKIDARRKKIADAWSSQPNEHNDNTRLPWQPELCADLQPEQDSLRSRIFGSSPADKGFVHFDESQGMAISVISNAEYIDIDRYRSTAIRLKSNVIKRLQSDRLFSLGWSFVLFAFLGYRKIARAYVMSRGRQAKLEAAAAAEAEIRRETDADPNE